MLWLYGKIDATALLFYSYYYLRLHCIGADTVRFKAEINFDGREVTRLYLSTLDLQKVLKVHEK